MRVFLLLIFILFSGSANAQFKDAEQQKSWLLLSQLSKDIRDLEECSGTVRLNEKQQQKLWEAYYKHVQSFVTEADVYVKKYSNTRTKEESVEAFRFGVWQTHIMVGLDEKRHPRGSGAYICQALILQ